MSGVWVHISVIPWSISKVKRSIWRARQDDSKESSHISTTPTKILDIPIFRLRCYSQDAIERKPGKQVVTFILVANISLFILQTFESTLSCHSIDFPPISDMTSNLMIDPTTAGSAYLTIVSIVSPLLVFYRSGS